MKEEIPRKRIGSLEWSKISVWMRTIKMRERQTDKD
jgi:hypothetical protein